MVKDFEYYRVLTELGVDKWKNVTGNINSEEYKRLLVECTKNLYDLKDSCVGRDCLVMGMAPSLLKIDKDKYKNHLKLACNFINRVPGFFVDDFKPDFWCGCNDLEILKDPMDYCVDKKIKIFVTTPNSMQFEEMLNFLKKETYLDNTFAWHWDFEILQKLIADKSNNKCFFSKPITIVIEMIAFAYWLGCDSITITGMDLSYLKAYEKYGMTHAGYDYSDVLFDDKNVGGAQALSREGDRIKILSDLKYFAQILLENNVSFINASYRENKIKIEGFENTSGEKI